MKTLSLLIAAVFVAAMPAASQTPAPTIFYSDLDSGPNTGGQNNNGAFVTIWGKRFGATQGSSYVSVGNGKAVSYPIWTDTKITFQLGPGATTGNISVTTGTSTSNGIPFTVRGGSIYFVSTSGNDSSNGSFASPWKTIVHCKNSLAPGDICYVMNGVSQTAIDNYDAALWINSAGIAGKPKAVVAYPGATVTIGTPSSSYGIRIAWVGIDGSYWTFSQLHLLGGLAMSPTGSTNWRVIGNNFQCPTANGQNGCFTSNEMSYIKFFGNEVTNVGVYAASKQQHAVYFSSDSNHIEAAWNYIHDNRSCRAIQFHSSPLGGTTGYNQYDLSVHDNVIHDDPCDGIEFETIDPSKGKVEAYNNIIYHVGIGPSPSDGDSGDYSCIRVAGGTNNGPTGSGTVEIYNNTTYDCGSYSASWDNNAAFFFDGWGAPNISVRLRNNISYLSSGEHYASGPGWSQTSGSNNLWFGSKDSAPTQTTGNIGSNPLFANLGGSDFHLQATSPAIDAGIAISSGNMYKSYAPWNGVPEDKDGIHRPQGSAFDIGAYEIIKSGSGSSQCDLNGDGTVDNTDVQIAVSQAVGSAVCSNADLQSNGQCNAVDVQRIVNASLGQACRVGP